MLNKESQRIVIDNIMLSQRPHSICNKKTNKSLSRTMMQVKYAR